ncbi:TetR/AcrR family transcriptional regulator [Streptomyces sp. NPDC088261]|uniref:TetR/AcrR family transcriptional regulator n=1 Tax=Streptomyces sp. NPDC088261 TaxID=3365851 RepID=UPI00381447F4
MEAAQRPRRPPGRPARQPHHRGDEEAAHHHRVHDHGEGYPEAQGERRIAQLLDAAANVFCTTGYTAASTNSIAREAGVSPGTLYQFFPNKEAIAVELGDQLLRRWRETYGQAFLPAHLNLPLDELLDAVLDPLIEFNQANPAFAVLLQGSETPGHEGAEREAYAKELKSVLHRYLSPLVGEAGCQGVPAGPSPDGMGQAAGHGGARG